MASEFDSAFVTVEWLRDKLDADEICVVDVTMPAPGVSFDARAGFEDAHIPGAVFLDVGSLADPQGRFPNTFPDAEHFRTVLEQAGIGSDKRIVLYDACGMLGAARVWWMLQAFGFTHAAVLNGGLQQWRSKNLPLESGPAKGKPASFQVRGAPDLVVDLQQTWDAMRAQRQIVDARAPGRFSGTDKEPRPGVRSGHIPGSRNVPYTKLLNDAGNALLEPSVIKDAFSKSGVDLHQPVICSCGSGVSACVLALALHEIGVSDVSVYDGSWTEWASHPDTPVSQS